MPGVDVMAYMMHMPVARWGRDFLERGLIEARFIKPVYDGEATDVTAEENNGVLAIEVHSRGELCATGSASLPAAAPSFSLVDYREVARGCRAQAGERRLPMRSANGSAPRRAAGPARRPANISPTSGKRIRSSPAKASAIPA